MSVDLVFNDAVSIATGVETGAVVEYSGSDSEDEFYWQSGFITIAAQDGSVFLVEPFEGQRGSFLITTSNGESVGPIVLEISQ